jgi:glucosyl-3-phosphoglycerate phosphatase
VFLIRHGQSAFNAAVEEIKQAAGLLDQAEVHKRFEELRRNPAHRDAPLSELGHRQAAEASGKARSLSVDLVLVSPLTRALQTAQALFGDSVFSMEASHLHAERLFSSCDVGRSPADLAIDFPGINFTHLDDVWWHTGEDANGGFAFEPDDAFQARVSRYNAALAKRPEQRIAVVGHGLFFEAVCGRHLDNCEIFPFDQ